MHFRVRLSAALAAELLLLLCLAHDTAEAQSHWSRTYGRFGFSRANDVEALPMGAVVAGSVWENVQDANGWLLRLDATGAVLWTRVVGGPAFDQFSRVRAAADGGFLALGRTESFGSPRPWLVRIESDGTIAWQRVWGVLAGGDSARDLVVTADGGAVVAGSSSSFGGAGSTDGWVARFDAQGTLQWLRTYGGAQDDRLNSIVAAATGGYLVAGSTFSFGPSGDAWALKLDASGAVEWQRRYDGLEGESVGAAAQMPDGDFVLAGRSNGRFSLMRIDAQGNFLWHKVGNQVFLDHGFAGVTALADGSIAAAGGTSGIGHFNFYQLWSLDADGVGIWTAGLSGAQSVRAAADGFLVAATTGGVLETARVEKVDLSGHLCSPPSMGSLVDQATTSAATAATSTSPAVTATEVAATVTPGDVASSLACADTAFPRASTPGLYDPATSVFYLRTSETSGAADLWFPYGPGGAGWLPLVGDWDGNGSDTVGLYDSATSTWYLRNSNTSGQADLTFAYGPGGLGWMPVVGDWNGDGRDTIGLYDPATATWYLRNSNNSGWADLTYAYGPGGAGWLPLAGRWLPGSAGLAGLYDPAGSAFYLSGQHGAPFASLAFPYGPGGADWVPLAGDWNGDGVTTCALFDPWQAVWYLRNSNDEGIADTTFAYGPAGAGWIPLAGDWNGR